MRYGFARSLLRLSLISNTWLQRHILRARTLLPLSLLFLPATGIRAQSPAAVAFPQSAAQIGVFDFVEVTASLTGAVAGNPFADGSITGDFQQTGSAVRITVEGFCDSSDGTLYRIRFMPSKGGEYTFHVSFKAGSTTQTYTGTFTAIDLHRRGPLRVHEAYPWHFVWEGTGEQYFFNGTTAYWLVGGRDERTIQYSIDRLAALKVNRMRVSLE